MTTTTNRTILATSPKGIDLVRYEPVGEVRAEDAARRICSDWLHYSIFEPAISDPEVMDCWDLDNTMAVEVTISNVQRSTCHDRPDAVDADVTVASERGTAEVSVTLLRDEPNGGDLATWGDIDMWCSHPDELLRVAGDADGRLLDDVAADITGQVTDAADAAGL